MEKRAKAFNTRSFVTLMMVFSGLGLPITGIANHFYGFAPLTVERHAWMTAHNILGLLFLIFALWHALLNGRSLLGHFKGSLARLSVLSREAVLAGALTLLTLCLFLGHAFHG